MAWFVAPVFVGPEPTLRTGVNARLKGVPAFLDKRGVINLWRAFDGGMVNHKVAAIGEGTALHGDDCRTSALGEGNMGGRDTCDQIIKTSDRHGAFFGG